MIFNINDSATEPAEDSVGYGGTSLSATEGRPQISTTSSPRLRAARWLAMVLSVANILGLATNLVLTWTTTAKTPLTTRIDDSVGIGAAMLFAAVIFLIVWRGGDQPANLVLALAFVFAFSNIIFGELLKQLGASITLRHAFNIPTFILGAGFFIRASQCFPRTLAPHDIASSRTIWGRIRPLRAVLIFFLRPPAVWVFVLIAAILNSMENPVINEANWVAIVLMGVIYFYIMYRSGDADVRRKVLWFFELALCMLLLNLLWLGVSVVLGNSGTLRVVVSMLFQVVSSGVQLFCICMAVFYAGAISPTLVIRKTFVYGVTVALLLFSYATAEAFVANFLVDKIGVSNSFANALLGTVLALAFHPIKNRLEHALRRVGVTVAQNNA